MIAYSLIVPACLGLPEVVEPGKDYHYAFKIMAAPRGSKTHPQFEASEIPGSYRLIWDLYDTRKQGDFDLSDELSSEARTSNTFLLTDQD